MKSLSALAICIVLFSCSSGDSPKEITAIIDAPKIIPGIAAFDIYGDFEQKGFTIDKKFSGSGCSFRCSQVDGNKVYTVDVYGKGPEAIDKVKATVMFEKADDDAKAFIGEAASVPYDGGDPAAALFWAAGHFEKGGDTTIGNVRFVLTAASPTARVLALYAH